MSSIKFMNLFFANGIISPIDVKSNQPIPIKELAKRTQVVSVDTLEAILNENYFIDLVRDALSLSQSTS